MRIGFFGTPHLAAKVFENLLSENDIETVFVVTNQDKPVGREQALRQTPVKQLAVSHGIPTFTPEKIRGNTEFFDQIRLFDCDYFIVVAYGKILPNEILDIPKKMCINVHGSLLPKYRGASPIQSALLHGERETGVTIMQMSEGMDEGAILLQEKIQITENETSGSLFEKFEQISGKALIRTLSGLEKGELEPIAQNTKLATYCTKIEKEDGLIDWSLSAEVIYRKWQAYTPWPGIYTMYEGKRLLLEKVSLLHHSEPTKSPASLFSDHEFFVPQDDGNNKPGIVIKLENGKIGVVCRQGILTLEQVKLEGKKSQSIKDFVNGNQKFISSVLYIGHEIPR